MWIFVIRQAKLYKVQQKIARLKILLLEWKFVLDKMAGADPQNTDRMISAHKDFKLYRMW